MRNERSLPSWNMFWISLFCFAIIVPRVGAEVTRFADDHIPSSEDIEKAYSTGQGDVSDEGVPIDGTMMGIRKPKGIDFGKHINFEFGSASLTKNAKRVLNNLGYALKGEKLGDNRFVIEGHTDSVGSKRFNQELSERRALSVKSYLMNTFNVEGYRLKVIGHGEVRLFDRLEPESAENRRVVVLKRD